MSILTSADRQKYQDFMQKNPLANIHQTFEWGLFQERNPEREQIWFITDLDQKTQDIKASALIIRRSLPFNLCWLYIPRGPLFDQNIDQQNSKNLQSLFEGIHTIAKVNRAVFVRFDPPVISPPPNSLTAFLHKIGARIAHQQYHPQDTLVLDLTKTTDQLLQEMKPKGRYNIKVAWKHNVKIRISADNPVESASLNDSSTPGSGSTSQISTDIATFYNLLHQTTSRDGFSGHDQQYYEEMLKNLGPNQAKLYLAEHDGKAVAGIIVTYFKDTATYYFGASSNEDRQTMAPYLLQWQAILDAKKAGFSRYDFLGIAPAEEQSTEGGQGKHNNESRHHLAGVTDFKLKFGGERLHFMPAQEIVYSPFWYFMLKLAKWWRKLRKRTARLW